MILTRQIKLIDTKIGLFCCQNVPSDHFSLISQAKGLKREQNKVLDQN